MVAASSTSPPPECAQPGRRALLAAAAGLMAGGNAIAAPGLGDLVADFTLPDVQGRRVRLSDHRGRLVVLQWINPGCPFVGKHYRSGSMGMLQRETAARGVVWLVIESNDPTTRDYFDPSELADWLRREGAGPHTLLMDDNGKVARALGARTASHSYLVGPGGRLLYAGAIDSIASAKAEDIPRAVPYLRHAIEESLAGRAANPALTRPYGCNLMLAPA